MSRNFRAFILAAIAISFCFASTNHAVAQRDKTRDADRIAMLEEQADSIKTIIETISKLKSQGKSNKSQIRRLQEKQIAASRALESIVLEYFLANMTSSSSEQVDDHDQSIAQLKLLHQIVLDAQKCARSTNVKDCQILKKRILEVHTALLGKGKVKQKKPGRQPEPPATNRQTEPSATDPVDTSQSEPRIRLDEHEKYILDATNAYRERLGLPTLKFDEKLAAASRGHSNDMDQFSFFSHDSPVSGKTRFIHRAKNAGTTAAAENIAAGAKDGKQAMELWINSQYHRASIQGDYRRIGIGRKDGFYTQMFGR